MLDYFTVKFTNDMALLSSKSISATALKENGYPDEVGIEEITIHYTDGTKSVFVPE